jgi:N12 class adenine-specific DNA methylase
VALRAPRLGADSPADAPAICLDTHSKVRLDEIARLLGTTEEVARAELGELLFDEPDHREVGAGRLVPAAEYLSGNVRTKLEAARAAALDHPRLRGWC